MHAGLDDKRSRAGSMCCPAKKAAYGDVETPDLATDCGGTISPTEPLV